MTALLAVAAAPGADAGGRLLYMPILAFAVIVIVAVTAWLDHRADEAAGMCPRCGRRCSCPRGGEG